VETSWIALALFSLAFALYRRSLHRACESTPTSDDAELDAVIGAIEGEP
jgi:hypothetical protein